MKTQILARALSDSSDVAKLLVSDANATIALPTGNQIIAVLLAAVLLHLLCGLVVFLAVDRLIHRALSVTGTKQVPEDLVWYLSLTAAVFSAWWRFIPMLAAWMRLEFSDEGERSYWAASLLRTLRK